MTIKVFISFIAIAIIISSCKENPAEISTNQAVREIHEYNLQNKTNSLLSSEIGFIDYLGFIDNNSIYFTNYYAISVKDGSLLSHKIMRYNTSDMLRSEMHYAPSLVGSLNRYKTNNLIFSSNNEIYLIKNNGAIIENITNSQEGDEYPVYLEDTNEMIYLTYNNNNYSIVKENLSTNEIASLISREYKTVFPLFATADHNKLVYFESNQNSINRGYIKTLEINNPANTNTLVEVNISGLVSARFSNNDKLAYSTDGKIYMVDINTNQNMFIGYGSSADITLDGSKIAFSDDGNAIRLFDISTNSYQDVIINNLDYAYMPRFSPDGNKLIYLTSDFRMP